MIQRNQTMALDYRLHPFSLVWYLYQIPDHLAKQAQSEASLVNCEWESRGTWSVYSIQFQKHSLDLLLWLSTDWWWSLKVTNFLMRQDRAQSHFEPFLILTATFHTEGDSLYFLEYSQSMGP